MFVLALAFCLAACVGAAMGFAVLSAEQGKIGETQRAVGEALADAIVNGVPDGPDRPSGAALGQQAVTIGASLGADLQGRWLLQVLDGAGHVLGSAPSGETPSWPAIVVRRALPDATSPPLVVAVSVEDTTEAALQDVLLNLLAGLAIAVCAGLEILRWLFARGVAGPMDIIAATAMAGVQGNYRRSPGIGDAGELGKLQTALARFLSFVTLQRQEVTLMLQDARRDTYDPELVARAGDWLDRLSRLARFAPDELGMMPMSGDAGLQRLLCFLAAVLLGLHVGHLASADVLAETLAAVLCAGRLGAVLPRWIGRRGAILLPTVMAVAILTLGPELSEAASLVIGAASLSLVLRAGTAGDAEPVGEPGLHLDAGAFNGAAAGLAVAATLLLLVPERIASEHDVLWPWGLALFGLVAVASLKDNLVAPARSVLPGFGDLARVLPDIGLCGLILLLVMPVAACGGLLLRASLGAADPDFTLLMVASGAWGAAVIARAVHRIPGFAFCSRAGVAALLLGAVALPTELSPWQFAVAGVLVGLLWHGASAALYEGVRARAAEQGSLRVAFALRIAAVILGVALASPMTMIGGALLVGALLASVLRWRRRRPALRSAIVPTPGPVT
jgi:hypothetical protein